MRFVPEKIKLTCQQLLEFAHRKLSDIPQEYVPAEGYKTSNTPPTEGWMPFPDGGRVRGRDAHYWFRCALKTPPAKAGTQYYVKYTTGFEGQWDATNPQGLVYANGRMIQGCDTNHTEVFLEADTEYTLHNYFYLGLTDAWIPLEAALWRLDVPSEQLYYDMQVALDTCMLYHPNSDDYIAILNVLERTANLLDLRSPGSESYYVGVAAAREYIGRELYEKLCKTEGKPVVTCVGHTHIDVEWLWARAQTREKIQRSFATAASLMERYPEYKFMLSQPELYRYLKEEAPEKYEELKALVAQGRWEPEGAMFVEADCNLISGESFIRQILQGKKFFRDEFGVDCKILFLPDVFGYSAAMPQILRKSGIRHFVTSKISWNETNVMPVDCFLWQGIDGTEIFTNFITTQRYTGLDGGYGNTTYVGMLSPSEIKGTWNKFLQKSQVNRALSTYGYGDGGGGPSRKMLETQRRLAKGLPGMPVTKMDTLLNHLDRQREEFDAGCRRTRRTPKWVGELYLEFHRGTYTSIAKNKRNNRKSELALQLSETLSYTDLLHGGSYDASFLWDSWTKVLHNQFHDIIPGSSIKEVYDGTDMDYAFLLDNCDLLIRRKLLTLADATGEKGTLVYNPLGFAWAGPAQVDGATAEMKETVPAFGWTVASAFLRESTVELHGLTAENRHYRLTLDKAGRIAELYDKTAQRQVLKAPGNELQIFEDFPREYDNWEITDYYKQKMWILDEEAVITEITDGSRRGFRVEKAYMGSKIVQKIWLYSESRRIDFETELDWHEHHQLLKAAFPLDVQTDSATYEIQFGHVRRPTHENTSWDKAKFEVYGHKWADLSEPGYGVSLLNDCKYGHNAEGTTLKLTLLKCGTYPNPEADQGKHVFTYSLLPHCGDFREAGTVREAYALNQPLLTAPAKGEGNGPARFSLVSCDKESVIIETVKKAEADDGMIVRLYESFGGRCTANIKVAPGFKKACLCDLMENVEKELPLENDTVTLPVSNFEIITLKFTR